MFQFDQTENIQQGIEELIGHFQLGLGIKTTDAKINRWLTNNLWPAESGDIEARLKFLIRAIQIARDIYFQDDFKKPDNPESWIFSGLFKEDRWLYLRTWESISSEQKPEPIPEELRELVQPLAEHMDIKPEAGKKSEPFSVRYAKMVAEGQERYKHIVCKFCLDTKIFGDPDRLRGGVIPPCPYCCPDRHRSWLAESMIAWKRKQQTEPKPAPGKTKKWWASTVGNQRQERY